MVRCLFQLRPWTQMRGMKTSLEPGLLTLDIGDGTAPISQAGECCYRGAQTAWRTEVIIKWSTQYAGVVFKYPGTRGRNRAGVG